MTRCSICNRKYLGKTWIARKGILKGQKITTSGICSKKCQKIFKLLIVINDAQEEINRLRRK